MRYKTLFLKASLSPAVWYQIRGIFIVTTQILPVISAEPKSPFPLLRSSFRSSCNLQHILLTAPGVYASAFGTLEKLPSGFFTFLY